MRYPLIALVSLVSASVFACFAGCSSSNGTSSEKDASTADSTTDAAKDSPVAHDASADHASRDAMVPDGDASEEASPPTPTVVAEFSKAMGQLPEGLWEVSPNAEDFVGTTGTPITAWAPAAAPVTVGQDGGVTSFGSLGSAAPLSSYTLGVITDAAGNVYYAVAAAAAPPNDPVPGIYKFPKGGGGTATVFSLGSDATPPMNFANGLDFNGADLFVADSEGVIYKVDPAGVASVWSNDALLAPSLTACGGKVPLPIGANGIVHDSANVYVTNTDYGRLIKIPMNADGSAGTAAVIKEDCATLVGADGLLIDPKDDTFIIALNILNEVVRVPMDGSSVTVLASGSPLVNPASPILDMAGGKKRLLVTNPAFFAAADAGAPSIVALPIP
jgi:hypothetical protein